MGRRKWSWLFIPLLPSLCSGANESPSSWVISMCAAQGPDFCQPRLWNNNVIVERCSCTSPQRTAGRRPVFNACHNLGEHCKSTASLSHSKVGICWLDSNPHFSKQGRGWTWTSNEPQTQRSANKLIGHRWEWQWPAVSRNTPNTLGAARAAVPIAAYVPIKLHDTWIWCNTYNVSPGLERLWLSTGTRRRFCCVKLSPPYWCSLLCGWMCLCVLALLAALSAL